TLIVENSGTVAATQTEIIDLLPDGVSYVEESTTLNGSPVNDVNGNSPLFSGMTVNSPDTENGVLFVGEENKATVTFKVRVDDEAEVGEKIKNIGSVSSAEIEEFESNEVRNEIIDLPEVNNCALPVALINGSFEEPVILDSEYSEYIFEAGPDGSGAYYALLPEDLVPGWKTTASDKLIEIWDESFLDNHWRDALQDGIPDGKQVAELNALEV